MEQNKIFISVGGTSTAEQEEFVKAVEQRLTSENLIPNTVGRNKFSANAPLLAVKELMEDCTGLIIIALERTYFEKGKERRGSSKEKELNDVKFTTPWNQIEAGMAYAKGLPILAIIEDGIRVEGLLEKGYDWYVLTVDPNVNALSTVEFNGVLSSWKEKVYDFQKQKIEQSVKTKPEELTIGQLIRNMKPASLWSIVVTISGLLATAFYLGQYFTHK